MNQYLWRSAQPRVKNINAISAVSFLNKKEFSKRHSSGQLPKATLVIQILLLVRLTLMVGTLTPQCPGQKETFFFVFAPQCAGV